MIDQIELRRLRDAERAAWAAWDAVWVAERKARAAREAWEAARAARDAVWMARAARGE